MTNRPQFSSVYRACVRLQPELNPNRCFTPRIATVGPMPEVPGALIGWFLVSFFLPDLFAYPPKGPFRDFGLPKVQVSLKRTLSEAIFKGVFTCSYMSPV